MTTQFDCDMAAFDGFDWDRQGVNLHMAGLAVHSVGAAVRGGVIPAAGTPLKYVAKTGLKGTLKAGPYLMAAPNSANGAYLMVLPADVDFDHTTVDATQPRTDLIIAVVNDTGTDTGGNPSYERFQLLTGTPGAGAPAPALPSSLGTGAVVVLASINMPASSGSGTLGTITDLRTFTAAAGGELLLPGAMALAAGPRAALAATLPDGQRWLDLNATPIAYGITRGGDLCPTNRRELYDVTRAGSPSYADVSGATPGAISAVASLTLVGGNRSLQVTGSFNAVMATSSIGGSLRVFLDGGGQSSATDWMQVKPQTLSGADRLADIGVWNLEVSGTVTLRLMALVEGSSDTVRVDGIRLQVHDLGPA